MVWVGQGRRARAAHLEIRQPAPHPARNACLQPLTTWGCMPGLSACKGKDGRQHSTAQQLYFNQCQSSGMLQPRM